MELARIDGTHSNKNFSWPGSIAVSENAPSKTKSSRLRQIQHSGWGANTSASCHFRQLLRSLGVERRGYCLPLAGRTSPHGSAVDFLSGSLRMAAS
jgi:hypothetical protein